MTELTDEQRALIEAPNFAYVGVPREDGSALVMPVWVHVNDAGQIELNSAEGRSWPRLARKAGRIGLTVADRDNQYEYVHVAGPIVEVPPLVADRFGQVMPLGWGWGLRMSSPRRVLDAIERLNLRGQPAVLTVHPWEIDDEPPRVRLPARLHFAHYFRMGGFADRLRTILSGGSFGPIGRIVPDATAGA